MQTRTHGKWRPGIIKRGLTASDINMSEDNLELDEAHSPSVSPEPEVQYILSYAYIFVGIIRHLIRFGCIKNAHTQSRTATTLTSVYTT